MFAVFLSLSRFYSFFCCMVGFLVEFGGGFSWLGLGFLLGLWVVLVKARGFVFQAVISHIVFQVLLSH